MPFSVNIRRDNLAKLFPAFILVEDSGRFIDVGPSLAQHLPEFGQGENLADHFTIGGNKGDLGFEAMANSGSLIELYAVTQSLRLSGMVLPSDNGWLITARHLPLQFSLESGDWQMSDFGPDDPVVAGLLLSGLQKAMLEEAKQGAVDLERQRQRSIKMLQRFSQMAGYMAHDFNNLLSIIQLKSGQLLDDQTLSRRNWRIGKAIKETAARGAKLTQSLMTLSKQKYDSSTPMPIDQLIRQNLEFLRSLCGNKSSLTVDLRSDGAFVRCNESHLLNCLVNIVGNARDAIEVAGNINISTAIVSTNLSSAKMPKQPPVRDYVLVTVADNGPGMSEAVIQQAFELLFSTKPTGNGIGLASVLDFARQMGGDARIDSSPGSGTSVHIYLPVMAQCDVPPDLPLAGDRSNAAEGGANGRLAGRALLVEDEPFALESLGELLRGWGLTVTMFDNAIEAREEIERRADLPFDLLLSDVLLAGISGIDLARYANSVSPQTRIILMSGFVPEDLLLEPDWQFVRKPLDPVSLRKTLAAVLDLPPN
jgi:signal transduction histidine kinase